MNRDVQNKINNMNKDVEINNRCNKSVTVQYPQRWGSNLVLDARKSIQPQEISSLEKVSRKNCFIAIMIPGFETAKGIPIQRTSDVFIRQETKNEIIISQGFDLLASMKALHTNVGRISTKKNRSIKKATL